MFQNADWVRETTRAVGVAIAQYYAGIMPVAIAMPSVTPTKPCGN